MLIALSNIELHLAIMFLKCLGPFFEILNGGPFMSCLGLNSQPAPPCIVTKQVSVVVLEPQAQPHKVPSSNFVQIPHYFHIFIKSCNILYIMKKKYKIWNSSQVNCPVEISKKFQT